MHKLTLNNLHELFITDGRARALSERTIEFYIFTWERFCHEMPNIQTVEDIKKSTFNEYMLILRQRDIAPNTVNTRLRGIRTFFNWLYENGFIEEKLKMTIRKAKKPIKDTYTDDEIKLLLKPPKSKKSFAQYRDWACINYLVGTGNRASTICNLKVKDIKLKEGVAVLNHTKNREQQIIPLNHELIMVLQKYIYTYKLDDWLFPTIYGEQMTVTNLANTIAKYNKNHGVNKRGLHLFRHTFAKMWIMNGGDVFSLKNMMGHSSIEILQEYVQLYTSETKMNNDKYNPLTTVKKPSRKKKY